MKLPKQLTMTLHALAVATHAGLRAWLLAVPALLLLAAGAAQTPGRKTGELARAKQRWTDTGIRDYQFTISRVCECENEGPMRVVVKNGAVSSARYTPGGQAVGPERLQDVPSIDALFDQMIANNTLPRGRVTWRPNKDYFYPEKAHVERHVSMYDSDVSYWLQDFSH
jgi:hypothetical protein